MVAVLLVVALGVTGAQAADREPARPAQPVVVTVDEGGFDWVDAGLGAAAGVAASLLIFAVVSAFLRPAETTE